MEKQRLEWIMSGLNRYKLTATEDRFIKLVEENFNQKSMLTEQQEDRLENLYKEKSRLIPNKTLFPPKENGSPRKKRLQKPLEKIMH